MRTIAQTAILLTIASPSLKVHSCQLQARDCRGFYLTWGAMDGLDPHANSFNPLFPHLIQFRLSNLFLVPSTTDTPQPTSLAIHMYLFTVGNLPYG